ncbi:hypothetical protein LOTGIDRAFT_174505 [Lottia gigantea]|uniref:Uncharacterized protein n=1 Tax=Lottia gigantea TaxID=225164 RepID=V4AJE3_LOTGI|nr:hypothetical protein LOTGIDRAFT_174505 [Lottia gigantea]ESO97222.1 hypothetical protein LOTGIDRAFT_174505 [Lottia gigantea]
MAIRIHPKSSMCVVGTMAKWIAKTNTGGEITDQWRQCQAPGYVLPGNEELLGWTTSEDLQLLAVVNTTHQNTLTEEYKYLFIGLGKHRWYLHSVTIPLLVGGERYTTSYTGYSVQQLKPNRFNQFDNIQIDCAIIDMISLREQITDVDMNEIINV